MIKARYLLLRRRPMEARGVAVGAKEASNQRQLWGSFISIDVQHNSVIVLQDPKIRGFASSTSVVQSSESPQPFGSRPPSP